MVRSQFIVNVYIINLAKYFAVKVNLVLYIVWHFELNIIQQMKSTYHYHLLGI